MDTVKRLILFRIATVLGVFRKFKFFAFLPTRT